MQIVSPTTALPFPGASRTLQGLCLMLQELLRGSCVHTPPSPQGGQEGPVKGRAANSNPD